MLNVAAMDEAAQVLVGRHDFTTFRSGQCQARSPVRTIDAISVHRHGDEVHLHVSAPSFLHNQVRSIAGSLDLVGHGKWETQHLHEALLSCDRRMCGPVAPPEGLYLSRVLYPDHLQRLLTNEHASEKIFAS